MHAPVTACVSTCMHLCVCVCELFTAVQMTPHAPHCELETLKHTLPESNRFLLPQRSAESKPRTETTYYTHTPPHNVYHHQISQLPGGFTCYSFFKQLFFSLDSVPSAETTCCMIYFKTMSHNDSNFPAWWWSLFGSWFFSSTNLKPCQCESKTGLRPLISDPVLFIIKLYEQSQEGEGVREE